MAPPMSWIFFTNVSVSTTMVRPSFVSLDTGFSSGLKAARNVRSLPRACSSRTGAGERSPKREANHPFQGLLLPLKISRVAPFGHEASRTVAPFALTRRISGYPFPCRIASSGRWKYLRHSSSRCALHSSMISKMSSSRSTRIERLWVAPSFR